MAQRCRHTAVNGLVAGTVALEGGPKTIVSTWAAYPLRENFMQIIFLASAKRHMLHPQAIGQPELSGRWTPNDRLVRLRLKMLHQLTCRGEW
jgi:hypothetical protein